MQFVEGELQNEAGLGRAFEGEAHTGLFGMHSVLVLPGDIWFG